MCRQVACFSQSLPRVNIDRYLMRKCSLFVYLQSWTCIRAFVRPAFGCMRQNPENLFWDGPWSRVIHFQEEVQVLIACSDRDNRFYRVSNAIGACSWRCSPSCRSRLCRRTLLFLPLTEKRKETTEERT